MDNLGGINGFIIGSIFGVITTILAEVVSTKLTRERHLLKAREVDYQGMLSQLPDYEPNPVHARSILLRNNGHYVERDVDIRLRVKLAESALGMAIEYSQPQLIQHQQHEMDHEYPYWNIDRIIQSRIEYLAPKQEIRIDLQFEAAILSIHFTAASRDSVAVFNWEHPDEVRLFSRATALANQNLGIDLPGVATDGSSLIR